jgi:hypothetical protein
MKYKVGDKVVCVPGYQCRNSSDNNYGGLGYEPNKVFVIRGINGDVLWPRGGGHGIYVHVVTLWEPITINRNIKKPKFI